MVMDQNAKGGGPVETVPPPPTMRKGPRCLHAVPHRGHFGASTPNHFL